MFISGEASHFLATEDAQGRVLKGVLSCGEDGNGGVAVEDGGRERNSRGALLSHKDSLFCFALDF